MFCPNWLHRTCDCTCSAIITHSSHYGITWTMWIYQVQTEQCLRGLHNFLGQPDWTSVPWKVVAAGLVESIREATTDNTFLYRGLFLLQRARICYLTNYLLLMYSTTLRMSNRYSCVINMHSKDNRQSNVVLYTYVTFGMHMQAPEKLLAVILTNQVSNSIAHI